MGWVIRRGRELPPLRLFWLDSDGQPVDLSSAGYASYSVQIEQDNVTSTFSGANVTANANPTTRTGSASDVPSVTLSFSSGATSGLALGPGVIRIVAVDPLGLDREGEWEGRVKA